MSSAEFPPHQPGGSPCWLHLHTSGDRRLTTYHAHRDPDEVLDNGRLQGNLGAPGVQLRLWAQPACPAPPWLGAAGRRRALTGGRGAHARSGGGKSSRSTGSRRARGAAPRSRGARAIRPGAAGPAGPLRAAAPYSLRSAPAPPPAPFVLNSPRRAGGRGLGGGGKGAAARVGAWGPGDPVLTRGGPSLWSEAWGWVTLARWRCSGPQFPQCAAGSLREVAVHASRSLPASLEGASPAGLPGRAWPPTCWPMTGGCPRGQVTPQSPAEKRNSKMCPRGN